MLNPDHISTLKYELNNLLDCLLTTLIHSHVAYAIIAASLLVLLRSVEWSSVMLRVFATETGQ